LWRGATRLNRHKLLQLYGLYRMTTRVLQAQVTPQLRAES